MPQNTEHASTGHELDGAIQQEALTIRHRSVSVDHASKWRVQKLAKVSPLLDRNQLVGWLHNGRPSCFPVDDASRRLCLSELLYLGNRINGARGVPVRHSHK